MSARSKMTMRAFLQRDTGMDVDENGQPVKAAFLDYLMAPCWAWSESIREPIGPTALSAAPKTASVEIVKAIVPRGTDVTSNDRVRTITDRRMQTKFTGPFLIDGEPQGREGHLLLSLRRVA